MTHSPEPTDRAGTPPGDELTSMPRWVKAFVVIAIVVVVLLLVRVLAGGDHGPARHVGVPGGLTGTEVARFADAGPRQALADRTRR